MRNVNSIREILYTYGGDSWLVGIFLAVLIFFLASLKGKNKKYVIYFVVCGIMIYNPIFYGLIKQLGGKAEYYRFLWLMPIVPMLSAGGVLAVKEGKNKKEKAVMFLLGILILFFAGKTYLTQSNMLPSENIYKIPDETIEISELIEEQKTEPYVTVAVDAQTELTLRQYDASFIYGISRETYIQGFVEPEQWNELGEKGTEEQMLMWMVNRGETFDISAMKNAVRDLGIDYIVVKSEYVLDDYMKAVGFDLIGSTDYYSIYGVKNR